MTWIFAAAIYKKYVPKVAVATVCTRVYLSGHINGYEDHLKQTKKPILRNFANMAGGVGIGLMEAAVFPVYLPALGILGIYEFFKNNIYAFAPTFASSSDSTSSK